MIWGYQNISENIQLTYQYISCLGVNLVIGFPERTQSAGMNSGFVQFKTRAQAELARTKLNGKVGRGDLVAKSGEITRIMVISTCFLH